MNFFKWLFRKKEPAKVTLGLALGSGGAKGFAEIGALRAFEENGITFDVVAGTSIGSVVGAFYANGFSSTDILELLKRVDFGEIKNLLMLGMDTSGLYNVIDKTIGSLSIEELKKPFRAVATEVESGDAYVFETGSVAKALCASAAIPPFFKPVVIDNVRYVDGAYSNSIPADVVKGLGADFIVGIDLSTRDSNAKPSILTKLFPTYEGKVKEPWAKGYEFSDVMIHPDLTGYKSISFDKGNEMYDIGYNAALESIEKIKSGIEQAKKLKNKKK